MSLIVLRYFIIVVKINLFTDFVLRYVRYASLVYVIDNLCFQITAYTNICVLEMKRYENSFLVC